MAYQCSFPVRGMRRGSMGGCAALTLAALLMASASAVAQAPKATDPKEQSAAPSAPQVTMPSAEGIVLLIRTTLLTLNDAVQTGNFTVLRDRAAPGFRDANTAARLGVIFSDLAQRGVDLSAVSILSPELAEAPAIDPNSKLLRIKGQFPGRSVGIDFDLMFQPVAGRWRVFGLSVQPVTTTTAGPATASETPGNEKDGGGASKSTKKKTPPAKK